MSKTPKAPPVKRMHYHEVRDQLQDGDLFFFRGKFRSSKLFTWLTKSFYSHAAVVARWDGRWMILQAEMKTETVPLSVAVGDYPGRADWYRLKREQIDGAQEKTRRMLWEAKSELGLPFGMGDLFKSLGRYLFHFKIRDVRSPKGMFCSEYVERAFRIGGMPLVEAADVATFPQDLAASPLIEYMGTIEHDPANPPSRTIDDLPETHLLGNE